MGMAGNQKLTSHSHHAVDPGPLQISILIDLGPTWSPLGRAKNKCALALPTCVNKFLSKFGCIRSSGLGYSIRDRWMEGVTISQGIGLKNSSVNL